MPYRFDVRLPILPRIFPPASGERRQLQPEVLADQVVLTTDLIGTAPYLAVSVWDNVGAADVVSIVQATPVPQDRIWIVDEVGMFTDDTVARAMTLWLHYINSAGDFAIPVASQNSDATSRWWPVSKRIVMPPGSKLELSVPALTAGKKIRYTAAYLSVPAGQFVPRS